MQAHTCATWWAITVPQLEESRLGGHMAGLDPHVATGNLYHAQVRNNWAVKSTYKVQRACR